MKTFCCFVAVILVLSSAPSVFAEVLSVDESGVVSVALGPDRVSIAPDGAVVCAGKRFDCSVAAGERQYVIGSSIVNCDAEDIIVSSGYGSLNWERGSGTARVSLTSGIVESVQAKRGEVGTSAGSNIVVQDEDNTVSVVTGNSGVRIHAKQAGQDVQVNAGDAAGLDQLGNLLGATISMAQGAGQAAGEVGRRLSVRTGGSEIVIGGSTVEVQDNSWRENKADADINADVIIKQLEAKEIEGEIQVDLADNVLFDFNSSAIQPKAAQVLAKIATVIRKKAKGEVVVEGHTDSIGSDEFNQNLSRERVRSVMRWLSEGEDIPAGLMRGVAFGEKYPLAHNTNPDGSDNPEGRSKNRRVMLRIAS